MGELGKVTKDKHVSVETKAKIIHNLTFLITMYTCESWDSEEDWKEKLILLKCSGGESSRKTLDHQKDEPAGFRAN